MYKIKKEIDHFFEKNLNLQITLILILFFLYNANIKLIFLSTSFLIAILICFNKLFKTPNFFQISISTPIILAIPFLNLDRVSATVLILLILFLMFYDFSKKIAVKNSNFLFYLLFALTLIFSFDQNTAKVSNVLIDIDRNFFFKAWNDQGKLRYSLFGFNPVYGSFLSIVSIYLVLKNNVDFFKKFLFFSILIVFLSESKSILIMVTFILFFHYKSEYLKKILILTIVLNFLIIGFSYKFYKSFPSPYDELNYSKFITNYCKPIIYDKRYLLKFNGICGSDYNFQPDEYELEYYFPFPLLDFFNKSNYYRFHNIGYATDHLFKNYKYYLTKINFKTNELSSLKAKYVEIKEFNQSINPHNLILKLILDCGFLYFGVFAYLFYRLLSINNYKNILLIAFIIFSSIQGLGLLIYWPLILFTTMFNYDRK